MSATTAVPSIGATKGGKFITHKMPKARTAMATPAKDPDLVNKITLLQLVCFLYELQIYHGDHVNK
jgi:hypothetical protein